MTISPGQLLVPIPDSCSMLGRVSRTTVYDLVNKGELVKVNIGRRGFITAESLAAYVDRLAEAASDTNTMTRTDDPRGAGNGRPGDGRPGRHDQTTAVLQD
jgi:hypothetical protein